MNLRIHQYGLVRMLDEAFMEMPREICGLLVEDGGLVWPRPCKNTSPDNDAFEMLGDDILSVHKEGLPIIGTYHSHPDGKAKPSEGDMELLPPDQVHFVIGMKGHVSIRAWRIRPNSQTPVRACYDVISL